MDRREIRFGMLLNEAERDALGRLADSAGGLSLGAMVRHLVRMEARRQGLWPATKQPVSDVENRGDSAEERWHKPR
jgi:hypothetical protein